MATTVQELPAPAVCQGPDGVGPARTREQVIGSLASAWRRVAGQDRRPPGSPLASSREGTGSGATSPASWASSLSSASSSSYLSSPSPGARRWWPLSRSRGGRHPSPLSSPGIPSSTSPFLPPSSSTDRMSNKGPESWAMPPPPPPTGTSHNPKAVRLWAAMTASLAKPKRVFASPFRASPVQQSVSLEAAQLMAHSLQEYHFNSLKHSVLHRLAQDPEGAGLQSLPRADYTSQELVRHAASSNGSALVLLDLSRVVRQFCAWRSAMPGLEAQHSVSVNADPLLLRALAALGVPLACHSRADVEAACALLARGYRATLIDAKPCKTPSHMAAVLAAGVRTLSVDSAQEVGRIAERARAAGVDPSCLSLLVRLRAPAMEGLAFGATLDGELPLVVAAAAQAGMRVSGLSLDLRQFGGVTPASAEAHVTAALAFAEAAVGVLTALLGGPEAPLTLSLLGLDKWVMGSALQGSVAAVFPPGGRVAVAIDASANLVDNAATLACRVIGKRRVEDKQGFQLYLDDGCYGSLGDVFLSKKKLTPYPLSTSGAAHSSTSLYPTTLWGPTCDGLDCIDKMTTLPELEIGDWVFFRNVGALSFNARTSFNGLPGPKPVHVFTGVAPKTVLPAGPKPAFA